MKGVGLGYAPIPSPAVLRFLRIQADSLSFLAAQDRNCWIQARRRHDTSVEHSTQSSRTWSSNFTTAQLAQGVSFESPRTKNRSSFHLGCSSPRDVGGHSESRSRNTLTPPTRRWFRPWHRIRQKPAGPLQPNDLPAPSLLDDNASLSRIVKPINELQLRCTEFDELGRVTLVNGAFKKSELIAKVCSSTRQRKLCLVWLTTCQSMGCCLAT